MSDSVRNTHTHKKHVADMQLSAKARTWKRELTSSMCTTLYVPSTHSFLILRKSWYRGSKYS